MASCHNQLLHHVSTRGPSGEVGVPGQGHNNMNVLDVCHLQKVYLQTFIIIANSTNNLILDFVLAYEG